ncbi:hypothetical protein PtB15_17B249 [Puccinia triticina]|nr:hypothetical protein PtB15_17B249 [Puccinia triticina]
MACALIISAISPGSVVCAEGEYQALGSLKESAIKPGVPTPTGSEGVDPEAPILRPQGDPEFTALHVSPDSQLTQAGHQEPLVEIYAPSSTADLLWHCEKRVFGNLAAFTVLWNFFPELFCPESSVFLSPGFFLSNLPSISCYLYDRFHNDRSLQAWR